MTSCATTLYGVTEHLHRYGVALELAKGKRVLDIACGEGYGAALLSDVAVSVVGIDTDVDVVIHASAKYQKPNLTFTRGRCERIPLPSGCVDLVVSFETLEHFSGHKEFLEEVKRVLVPSGLLLLSTPNRPVFSEAKGLTWEFHVKELDGCELQSLLAPMFKHVVFYRQALVYGSYITPADRDVVLSHRGYGGDYARVKQDPELPAARFFLALCSDITAPTLHISLFECALPHGRDSTDICIWKAESEGPVGGIAASLRHLLQAARCLAVAIVRSFPTVRRLQQGKR